MKRIIIAVLILGCGTCWGFDDPQYRINGLWIKAGHAIIIGGTEVSNPDFPLWDPDNYVLASIGDITAVGRLTAAGVASASATIGEATIGILNSFQTDSMETLLVDSLGGGNGVQKTWPFDDSPAMQVIPTEPASTSVVVQPGSGIVALSAMAIVADVTLTFTPTIGFDRIDLILVGPDGVPFIIQGSPGNPPEAPSHIRPDFQMLLYEVYVRALPSVIETNDLTDERTWL